jgi:hypothetical protein
MCDFVSGILTRTRVLYSETSDSHTDILKECGIRDLDLVPDFVKFELTPPNDGDWDDPGNWNFVVDQDNLPSWFEPAQDAPRARTMLLRKFPEGFKKGLSVPGNLYLVGITKLSGPTRLSAGGFMMLDELNSLPDNVELSAEGSIHLRGLNSLPNNAKLSTRANLYLSYVTDLPGDIELSVFGCLFLGKALKGKGFPAGARIKAGKVIYSGDSL